MTSTQRRNTLTTIKLNVRDAEHLREILPISGLFDLTDCTIDISAPGDTPVHELQLINTLLESAINITAYDIRIGFQDGIDILIKDVPLKRAKNVT